MKIVFTHQHLCGVPIHVCLSRSEVLQHTCTCIFVISQHCKNVGDVFSTCNYIYVVHRLIVNIY